MIKWDLITLLKVPGNFINFFLLDDMVSRFLEPVKTEEQIYSNSMPEDDPNSNVQVTETDRAKPRWGPNHAGAKELAGLYTTGNDWINNYTLKYAHSW